MLLDTDHDLPSISRHGITPDCFLPMGWPQPPHTVGRFPDWEMRSITFGGVFIPPYKHSLYTYAIYCGRFDIASVVFVAFNTVNNKSPGIDEIHPKMPRNLQNRPVSLTSIICIYIKAASWDHWIHRQDALQMARMPCLRVHAQSTVLDSHNHQ